MGWSYMVVQKCAQYAMNILKPEPNRRLADDIVKCHFFDENYSGLIQILLNLVILKFVS